jgi:hypothetical protein
MTLVLYKICTALEFSLDSIILTTALRENLHAILQETREKLPKYEYLLGKKVSNKRSRKEPSTHSSYTALFPQLLTFSRQINCGIKCAFINLHIPASAIVFRAWFFIRIAELVIFHSVLVIDHLKFGEVPQRRK